MSSRAALKICWLGHDCQYVINRAVITPSVTTNHSTVPQSVGVCSFYLAMTRRAALKICWLSRDCQYVINTAVITPSITINHFTVPQSAGVRYFYLGMSSRAALKICWLGRECQYVINTTMHRNKHNITYLLINTAGITPCITINHFTVPQSTGVCYFDLAMSSRAALKICWLGRDCQYVTNTTVITSCITINHFTVPQSAGVRYYFHLGMSSRAVLKICWFGRDCQYVINTTMHRNKHNITYLLINTTGITPCIPINHFTVPQSAGVCYFYIAMSRRAALKICWLGRDCQYVINTTMHRNKHNITYLLINTAVITPCITINHFTVPQSAGVRYFYFAMSSRAALKICWFGRDCQYVINTTGITPSITINHFTVPQSAGVRYYFHLGMSSRAVLKICWLGRDCQYVINTTMHRNKHNITYLLINTAGIIPCITINHFTVP